MGAFKFKLSQCVMVPGFADAQGRISGRSDFVGEGNAYRVTWLDPQMQIQSATFSEDEIVAAGDQSAIAITMAVLKDPRSRDALAQSAGPITAHTVTAAARKAPVIRKRSVKRKARRGAKR